MGTHLHNEIEILCMQNPKQPENDKCCIYSGGPCSGAKVIYLENCIVIMG